VRLGQSLCSWVTLTGLYFKRIPVYVECKNKGGIHMNPYEQFQLNKEVEEMAKQRIEIHKKRIQLSEELENSLSNEELQGRIIELEEESQKLKKKIEALQANF
jgi:seryl-tRNA synthetase